MGKKRGDARKGLESVFFTRTEPEAEAQEEAQEAEPAKDKSVSKGVALKQSEWDSLTEIAHQNNISRNALIRYALVHFIAAHEVGDAEVEFEAVRQLKMPD